MDDPSDKIGPPWPPPASAYDYILTLNDAELAWEFMRRNPDYQDAAREKPETFPKFENLKAGPRLWRETVHAPDAQRWNLSSFRRSGPHRPRSTTQVAAEPIEPTRAVKKGDVDSSARTFDLYAALPATYRPRSRSY